MGSVYRRMLDVLDSCTGNPYLLLKRKISLFYGPSLPCTDLEDILYESFNDDITCSIRKKFCSVLKLKCEKLFTSFLQPSGQFFNPSNVLLDKCKSCPTNNISVERLMGQLDKKITDVPTYDVFNLQSTILFNDNKTDEWIKKNPCQIKKKL